MSQENTSLQAWWLKLAILAAQEVEIWRIMVRGQPRQKSSQDPISTNKNLGMMVHPCHPSC
jgi:hypothetical protein